MHAHVPQHCLESSQPGDGDRKKNEKECPEERKALHRSRLLVVTYIASQQPCRDNIREWAVSCHSVKPLHDMPLCCFPSWMIIKKSKHKVTNQIQDRSGWTSGFQRFDMIGRCCFDRVKKPWQIWIAWSERYEWWTAEAVHSASVMMENKALETREP